MFLVIHFRYFCYNVAKSLVCDISAFTIACNVYSFNDELLNGMQWYVVYILGFYGYIWQNSEFGDLIIPIKEKIFISGAAQGSS